jgi:hypothetical protein
MARGWIDPQNLAVVAVRPRLHFFTGQLSVDFQALNEAAILDHWSDLTDKHALGQQLRRLP